MRFRNGLTVGGRIVRYHVARCIIVPLASFHRPTKQEWSWLLEWYRYRKSSGVKHRLFAFDASYGFQSHIQVHLLWLGCLSFMWQRPSVLRRANKKIPDHRNAGVPTTPG